MLTIALKTRGGMSWSSHHFFGKMWWMLTRRALLLARERHCPELVGVAPRVALGVEAHLARGEHAALDGVDLTDVTSPRDRELVGRPALLRLVGEVLADDLREVARQVIGEVHADAAPVVSGQLESASLSRRARPKFSESQCERPRGTARPSEPVRFRSPRAFAKRAACGGRARHGAPHEACWVRGSAPTITRRSSTALPVASVARSSRRSRRRARWAAGSPRGTARRRRATKGTLRSGASFGTRSTAPASMLAR